MARLYLFQSRSRLLRVLYTVDQAVGRARPNKSDDVALVQFLVRRVLEGWNDPPPNETPLHIDGIFGEQTRRYIEYWQKGENKRSPGWMVEDGTVSPMAHRSGRIAGSGNTYTIVTLNTNYADRFGTEWHCNIAIDPLCPVNLLPSIFWG